MAYKKIKKSATLTGIVISLLIVMGVFFGLYLWLQYNAVHAGAYNDPKYSDTYQNLTVAQSTLDNNVNRIKDNLINIKEADNTFQVAWNGLKFLGSILTMPISFISSAIDTYQAVSSSSDIIPIWVSAIIFTGIVALIVFIILAILKGDPKL